MNTAATILDAELTAGATALDHRVTVGKRGGGRMVVAAVSADWRWGYEKEGRHWVAFERASNGVGALPSYHGSLNAARQHTFELDHPMYGPEREPAPARTMRFTVL